MIMQPYIFFSIQERPLPRHTDEVLRYALEGIVIGKPETGLRVFSRHMGQF